MCFSTQHKCRLNGCYQFQRKPEFDSVLKIFSANSLPMLKKFWGVKYGHLYWIYEEIKPEVNEAGRKQLFNEKKSYMHIINRTNV